MDERTKLQMEILGRLEDAGRKLFKRELLNLADEEHLTREVLYLKGHGLVEASVMQLDGAQNFAAVTITSRGSDVVRKEINPIGAELRVVTIKIHEDTIRALLIDRVRESDADDTVKGKLIDQLKSLPAEAASKLAERALDQALRYMPNAIQWLQTAPWS
jgi:hypothetical protein